MGQPVTLNERAWALVEGMVADAESLNILVQRLDNGALLLDCGVAAQGGYGKQGGVWVTPGQVEDLGPGGTFENGQGSGHWYGRRRG